MGEQSGEQRAAEMFGAPEESKMEQSFYRKEGLDFLYFQRPGTAYGKQAFNAAGTATRSGFFDASQQLKVTKPVEMLASKKPSLVQQLWFERANKILASLEHLLSLVELFEFAFALSARFAGYLAQTTGNKYELRSFLELYSTWQPSEYDPFSEKSKE